MKLFLMISLAFGILSAAPLPAFACSCASNPDYLDTLVNADTAFQGTVVKIEDGSGFQKVHFMIHSVQKGDLQEGYFVMTNVNLYFDENKTGMVDSCDPNYREAKTYQVFGWGSTEKNPVGETNMCSTKIIGSKTLVLDEHEEFQEETLPPHDPYSDDESLRIASEKKFLAEESMGFGSGIGIFSEYSFAVPILIIAIVAGTGSGIGLTLYWRKSK